jgi:hypothetical protein
MGRFIILLLLFFRLPSVFAQEVYPSDTYVRTCISDIECSSINSSSFIYYDESRAKFYIKIDFNLLKTGIDSVDFWLEDLTGTNFYFKASLPPDQLPGLSNYNRKNVRLAGQVFMNGVWRAKTIDFTFFRAETVVSGGGIDGIDYDATRVNFNFSIEPKDFNIHKKPMRLTKTIFVGVGAGRLNVLLPGMENQLGEAFNHVD